MPEQNENMTQNTDVVSEPTAPDYKAEAVAALAGWIAEGEARLAALTHVPGHIALGHARSSLECALATLRADLAIVGGTH